MDTERLVKPGRSKLFKWLVRLAVVLVLYTVTGFFIVPAVIKSQMLKRLPALTHRQAAVEQVKFNPYALSLTIRGLSLKEPSGEVFSSFDELYVNFQLSSIFRRKWTFAEISLKGPFAAVEYRPDGTFNFSNLLTNSAPAPKGPPSPLPAVLIYQLSITNGSVSFADLKRRTPFRTSFLPINVSLTNLTTVRDRNSPYSFIARSGAGEVFAWSGSVTVNPLRSVGTFRLGGLRLPNYMPYAEDFVRFQIADGAVDVAADYKYDSVNDPLDLTVTNASVFLTKLELKASDTKETVVSIPSLSVTQADAGVVKRTAHVGQVKSSGGFILARQNQDGTINLLSQLVQPPKDATPATQPVSTNAPAWTARIEEITFDNYSIQAEDRKPAKPATFNLDQLGFTLKGVSNVSNAPVSASLSVRFQQTGFISVNGSATLLPPSADLGIGVTNLDLRAIQPYVAEQLSLIISGGSVNVSGHARYAPPEPGAPLISFTGDVAVNKFATTDDILLKDFVKWDALDVSGIHLAMHPDKLRVDSVKFTALDASVIRGPDTRLNLQTILRMVPATNAPGSAPATTSPPPAPAPRKLPDVSLGALVFDKASYHVLDQSIEPRVSFTVEEFSGNILGLSSQENSTATVDLHGKVDARSPFAITGKLNPLAQVLFADIAVTFTNTELTSFTPYTEKYAGRPLEKGKLSFGVHYLVNNKDLKAENGFFVDQLTLGAKNNSPDATSLPVKLAIALLKDRNGRIQLDVPLSGKIDDPKFRVMPIIWQVVINLMVKAATSPFSLLGAAFGGGEEMSYVDFGPGSAAIPDTETNKLNTLATALYERPTVSLEITGSTDPGPDKDALARAKLADQIKTLWLAERAASNNPVVTGAETNLPPQDYERLLTMLYVQTVGTNQPGSGATNATTTNAPASQSANRPPIQQPRIEASSSGHGASLLLRPTAPAPPVVPASGIAASTPAAAAIPGAPTAAGPDLAQMETELAKRIPITDDDLRDLMQTRANKVQAYLLQSGKVTAERLFIIAPKPVDQSAKGESRAKMSLD